ncbi:MAG: dihydroorotase [Candidatus Coatesbacteria bacterium]|nr:MAG: dihydroorotase [Candidatus Coatesbacteria bacterium]
MTLLIRNGRVLDPSQELDAVCDLLLEEGRVAACGENLASPPGAEVYDASGLWVFPGVVDLHVHISEPTRADRETVASLSRAAAAGGVTTAVCRPNDDLPLDNITLAEFLHSKNRREGLVRLQPVAALTRGLRGESLTDVGDLVTGGAVALGDDRPVMNSQVMRRGLEYARTFGVPVLSFAQDESLAAGGVMNEGFVSTALGLRGIPWSAEEVMVIRDVILARMSRWRIHLSPVTVAGSVELIRRAKADGIRVTCDTSPHYFWLTERAVEGYNTYAKVAPPLRGERDVEAVKAGLADGTIDAVASHHVPLSIVDKDVEFNDAAFGIAGIETLVPLTYTALVEQGGTAPLDFVRLLATGPASLFGLGGGTLRPGAPADVTAIDVAARRSVAAGSFFSRGKNTPFEGREVTGWPVLTVVGGEVVLKDGRIGSPPNPALAS